MKYSQTISVFSQGQTDFMYFVANFAVTKRNKRTERVVFNDIKNVKSLVFFNCVNWVTTNLELVFKRKQLSKVDESLESRE